ncbi:prolyl oligopeptidase family serine peptidase [Microtetraspora malaysiensis]|uniref:prolyl oligopeptidase family serine peptidase n=1 Tax=Microtetraspora malaysiensis TaxID=161358 RepID=UPI003D8ABA84
MSGRDVRGSATWDLVEEHFRRLHEPVMGRPHKLLEPSCSADGSRIAVTGLVYDELAGLPRQACFLVDGAELRPLTGSSGSSRQPRFSPDGTTVAFLSDRTQAGRFQLYLLRTGQLGEAETTPAVPGTVEYCSWSPDGTKVLLGVAGLGADLASDQGSGTTYKPQEELPDWHPRVEIGVTEESWRSLWIHDPAAGTTTRLSPEGLNIWEAVWLGPDAVVAVTSPAPDEGAWYTAVLSRLGLDGAVTELARSEVQLGCPAASPSGGRLAVVEAVCSDRGVVAGDLLVSSPGAALQRVDTGGVDVTSTQWIDADRLGILGIRGMETVAAVYDAVTGKTTELWSSTDTSCGTRYPEAAWSADGRVVLVEEGYSAPQRVVVLGEERVELAEIRHSGTEYLMSVAGKAETVTWSAPDGLRIEGILCVPAGDGPFPLVVNIHGGPVWAYRNLWSMSSSCTPLLVAQGYAVLNPNPRGSSGRGQDFARLVFGEMGGADTDDFTSAIDALVERGIVDPARVGLTGGSYGGYMSSWLVTQDRRWAAAVPISPVTDWYSQHFTSNIPHFDALFLDGNPEVPGDKFHSRSPVTHAGKVRTPCLNIAGALDRCTPPTQAQEFHQALLEHGVESQLVIYPQEGHGVRRFPALIDFCTRVVDWFQKHMPARG